jgi:hypothetical protein
MTPHKPHPNAKRRCANRVLLAAPWTTVAMLIALSVLLPNRSELSADSQVQQAQIAAAMAEAPFFIGRWVGEDASQMVPREAQALLHPNAIMSRTYRSPAGPTVQVFMVHCSDARDMIGHYPPICYPSAGWLEAPNPASAATISADDRQIPVREYVFQRYSDRATVERIRILNCFILPSGRTALDIDDINRQSERLALSVQGVAQLQIMTAASVPLDEALAAAGEILGGMGDMLDKLQVDRADHEAATLGDASHKAATVGRGTAWQEFTSLIWARPTAAAFCVGIGLGEQP